MAEAMFWLGSAGEGAEELKRLLDAACGISVHTAGDGLHEISIVFDDRAEADAMFDLLAGVPNGKS